MKILSGKNVGTYLVFGTVIAILYGHVLGSYWLFDDLQILRHAEKYRPWEYFFIPQVWRELSISNLTPLVTLSFGFDFTLFGFNPKWFYLHQLISLWLVSIMLYLVLRLWIPRIFAVFGVFFFLVSAPAGLASEFLMIRHYIEGSALMLLSIFMFVTALRRSSSRLAFAAAVPYFLAMSAKEIYVPLAVIVLFLPEKKWLFRVKYAYPLIGTLIIYFVWRSRMLGRTLGGYRDTLFGTDVFSEVYRIVVKNPLESIKMLTGVPTFASFTHGIVFTYIGIFLLVSILVCIIRKQFSILIFFVILLFMVYAPISFNFLYLDVADFATYRWVYFVSLFYSSLVALMAYQLSEVKLNSLRWPSRRIRYALQWVIPSFCVTVFAVLFFSTFQWITIQRKTVILPLYREGIFLMDHDDRSLLEKTFVFPFYNYYKYLDYFKRRYSKTPIPAVVYGTYAFVNERNPLPLHTWKVYKYNGTLDIMTDITQDFLGRRNEYLSHIRKLPFQVELTVANGRLNYSLGPSDKGRYFLVTGFLPNLYLSSTDIPRNLPDIYIGHTKWYARFGWESPERWITFSPEWFLDFSNDQKLSWRQ